MEERSQGLAGLSLLETLVQSSEVKQIWFNKKEVTLDGHKFVGCRFDNCTLKISSVYFEMIHCYLDQETMVVWEGQLVKPLRLFNSRFEWAYSESPYFSPTRHDDGTISITMDSTTEDELQF